MFDNTRNPFIEARNAGLSPIPVKKGSKVPAVTWKQFQTEICSELEAVEWGNGHHFGVGLVTGEVSGRLMAIDIEARFAGRLDELAAAMKVAGVDDIFQAWIDGYSEATPSGGLHILVRLEGEGRCPPNQVFAADSDGKPLIETRGEGGYVLVAPTVGYMLGRGGFGSIVYCTWEEWCGVAAVLAGFDETPSAPERTVATRSTVALDPILRFDSWVDDIIAGLPSMWTVLENHGFVFVRDDGKGPLFRHPTSTNDVSVRINLNGRLYVFSSSLPLPASSSQGDRTYDVVDVEYAYQHGHPPDIDERVDWLKAQRPPAERDAGARSTAVEPAIHTISPEPVCIADWFWETRPLLGQIRDASMERGLSPDGVLGTWISDYATTIPMGIWVAGPPARAPLNIFAVLVGSSGTGKTGSMRVAADLLGWNHNTNPNILLGRGLRSGEGLCRLAQIPAKRGDEGPPAYRNAVQVAFDEGGVMSRQTDRTGATMIPYLNTAWSGHGTVGGALAREIFEFPAELVRICAILGVQYGAAANLFEGESARLGFPQRLLYFGLSHPALRITDDSDVDLENPNPAEPLDLPWWNHSDYTGRPHYLHFPPDIERATRLWRRNKDHGNGIDDPLDAHQMNLTKRTAAIFALADRRQQPNDNDWTLATHLYATSRQIRTRLLDSLKGASMERTQARVNEAVMAANAVDDHWITKRAQRILRHLTETTDGYSAKQLKTFLSAPEKRRFNEIADYAVSYGWLIHRQDRYYLGTSQPRTPVGGRGE